MNETEVQRCTTCVQSKMSRLSFRSRAGYRAGLVGKLIHSDVCSYEVPSREGFCYFVTFVDDYSKFTVNYPMKCKSDVFVCFKAFRTKFERQLSTTIKKFRTDGGGEYVSKDFRSYLSDAGILHDPGLPHSPQLNGVAERTNRTISNHVRCSLSSSGLPKTYWVDALRFLSHSLNSIPCHTTAGFVSPCSLTSVRAASLSTCHPFGCEVYFKVPEADRRKLDPKGRRGLLLSHLPDGNGYTVWDLKNRKAVKTRDVVFHDDIFPSFEHSSPPAPCRDVEIPWPVRENPRPSLRHRRLSVSIHNPARRALSPSSFRNMPSSPPSLLSPVCPSPSSPSAPRPVPALPPVSPTRDPSPVEPPTPRRSARNRAPPKRLGNFVNSVKPTNDDAMDTPKTWK